MYLTTYWLFFISKGNQQDNSNTNVGQSQGPSDSGN